MKTAPPAQWPAPGKLNLFLFVTGRRQDGYHTLQTLFQLLDYGDTLTITPRQDSQIRLLTSLPGVADEQNLVLKAAKLLQHTSGSRQGADIALVKRLPLGGGLGGGSSNAATTLAVLNKLWGCCLPPLQLQQLGLMLGADVPLFLTGRSAFAQGIGEQLRPISLKERWYLILHPGIQIDTTLIFNHAELKRDTPVRSFRALRRLPDHHYRNDCEAVAKKYFPQVEALIAWLLHYAPARLTGTGACVFAEFPSHAMATQVLRSAPTWAQGFIARGVDDSPLRSALANQ